VSDHATKLAKILKPQERSRARTSACVRIKGMGLSVAMFKQGVWWGVVGNPIKNAFPAVAPKVPFDSSVKMAIA
jgi:hypothetical protein